MATVSDDPFSNNCRYVAVYIVKENGVNFINILRAAFMRTDPERVKKAVKSSLFCFWDLQG